MKINELWLVLTQGCLGFAPTGSHCLRLGLAGPALGHWGCQLLAEPRGHTLHSQKVLDPGGLIT